MLQNRVYPHREAALASQRGDMVLVQDLDTGLVHNAAFDPALVVYDSEYQNEQAYSPQFRQHLDDVVGIVERLLDTSMVVEVGCGKGYFLELMLSRGAQALGFDPTYEGGNPAVRREFFSVDSSIHAPSIVLRHVLEHVTQPVEFLANIARANGGAGRIYIEVPCLDWIGRHRAWFDVFYEHVNYFRLSDFDRMFGSVLESGRLFGGQYIYAVVDLATLRTPAAGPQDLFTFPVNFSASLSHWTGESAPPGPMVVWGASSKGVIFTLERSRKLGVSDVLVDINPHKQGRFAPVTGLAIHGPEAVLAKLPAGSLICVMNSNYLPEIRATAGDQFNYVGVDKHA